MKKVTLTPEETAVFKDAFWKTWNAIGADVEAANGGKSCSKAYIVSAVTDCDFMKRYGGLTTEQYAKIKDFLVTNSARKITAIVF